MAAPDSGVRLQTREGIALSPDSNPMIQVDHASVVYRLYTEAKPGLRSLVRSGFSGRSHKSVRALRDVSFQVNHGEVVGIVGANGCGKSTLLSAIAGLLPLTSGDIRTSAQPVLLGVSSALKPGLSGRKNVTLGLLALGYAWPDVSRLRSEVIAFADLGESIDHPMRTYSSGMRARLHLAIATSIQPEILLIDEALAVGDKEFRGKSYARIDELRENAHAVLLVSHSLPEIERVAARCLWIADGELRADGPTADVLSAYVAS